MKGIKILAAVFLTSIVLIYILFSDGTIDPNKTRINEAVYLVRENAYYSIYCEQSGNGIKSGTYLKLIATKLDSIIVSHKYGTLFHGYNHSTGKMEWFYIDMSPVKNVHTGFTNIQDATSSTMGEIYLDSVLTPGKVWKRYN